MSIMKCDICGEEVDNSEDLAKHMEKMHAIAETEKPEEKAAKEAEEDVPDPAPIPGRM
jgi:hypothetical protein